MSVICAQVEETKVRFDLLLTLQRGCKVQFLGCTLHPLYFGAFSAARTAFSLQMILFFDKIAENQRQERVSGGIRTIDEYPAKGRLQKPKSVPAEKFPQEQVAVMMVMVCFTDGIIARTNDFLKWAGTFAQISRENLTDVLKMLDAINGFVRVLCDAVTDCIVNG